MPPWPRPRLDARSHTAPGARLLLVDDEEAIVRALARQLGRSHQTTCVTSGEAALQALAAGPYDAVLLDFAMPGMDGLELARRIEAGWPALPCVLVTGYPDLQRVVAASARPPFVAVVAKPWEAVDVEHALRRALRRTADGPGR